MDSANDDQIFLRDLVKTSRQKIHFEQWVDRDGTDRRTTLTPTEAIRLNALALCSGISKSELLRRAAQVPVARSPLKPKE